MAQFHTHYDNLKVTRNAPFNVIKAAYKTLCQTYHPDKCPEGVAEAQRMMNLITNSYAILSDPIKRAQHDAWIKEQEEAQAAAAKAPPPFSTVNGHRGAQEAWSFVQDDSPLATDSPPLWRRALARLTDYGLGGVLLMVGLLFWTHTGQTPDWLNAALSEEEAWFYTLQVGAVLIALSGCLLEAISLSAFGTTLGKTLWGLQLHNQNPAPPYWTRSVAVWALGTGFGLPWLASVLALYAGLRLKRTGSTVWDDWTGFWVADIPFSPVRRAASTLMIVSLLAGNGLLAVLLHGQSLQGQELLARVTTTAAPLWPDLGKAKPKETPPAPPPLKSQRPKIAEVTPSQIKVNKANELFRQRRYTEALPLILELAKRGHPEAEFRLGMAYAEGLNVPQDDGLAAFWYEKSAMQNYPYAQYNLGLLYRKGKGVIQNDKKADYWYSKAVYWYNQAAEQGDNDAQLRLGVMYAEGNGVPKNLGQALYWLGKAAAQGNQDAKETLDKLRAVASNL